MSTSWSLYVHIPFCTKKCDYCHFFVIPNQASLHEQLVNAIQKEWAMRSPLAAGKDLTSIYFGGGTPALLGPDRIGQLLDRFGRTAQEITLEANPEDITPELLRGFSNAGINRLSLGVQSLEDSLLQRLSRRHSAEKAKEAVFLAKEAGIASVSIDLMYDVPFQTTDDWAHTLAQAKELPIDHISIYNLTFEPRTVFFKKRDTLLPHVPTGGESRKMYEMAVHAFSNEGWRQYEISAFAKNGHISHHNTGYWLGRPFFGLGPSAFSFWEGRRFQNIAHFRKYCAAIEHGDDPTDFTEQLETSAARRERFLIALRMVDGINIGDWYDVIEGAGSEIIEAEKRGWLQKTGSTLSLTDEGRLFYDEIAAAIV